MRWNERDELRHALSSVLDRFIPDTGVGSIAVQLLLVHIDPYVEERVTAIEAEHASDDAINNEDMTNAQLGVIRERQRALRAEAEIARWPADWETRFPCDGMCVEYPEEDCSRHGRKPADIWRVVEEISGQRDRAWVELAALQERVVECNVCDEQWAAKDTGRALKVEAELTALQERVAEMSKWTRELIGLEPGHPVEDYQTLLGRVAELNANLEAVGDELQAAWRATGEAVEQVAAGSCLCGRIGKNADVCVDCGSTRLHRRVDTDPDLSPQTAAIAHQLIEQRVAAERTQAAAQALEQATGESYSPAEITAAVIAVREFFPRIPTGNLIEELRATRALLTADVPATQELHGSTQESKARLGAPTPASSMGSAGEADIDPDGEAAHRQAPTAPEEPPQPAERNHSPSYPISGYDTSYGPRCWCGKFGDDPIHQISGEVSDERG